MPEEEAKKEESKSEDEKDSDSANFDKEKEQAQVWTGKITAFVSDQLRSAAPSLPIIGGGITGGLTWLHQRDTVNAIVAGGVGFIVTGIFTYGSSWSKAFLEIAKAKGKEHGQASGTGFFGLLENGWGKIRWLLANPDGKYLIKLRDSDCLYDEIEGVENANLSGFSTPELDEIFINLQLNNSINEGRQDDNIWCLLSQAKSNKGLRRLLVRAQGGRGKTTLLRHLAYNYAIKRPKENAPFLIPVLLRLRKWQEEIFKTENLDLPTLIEQHIKKDVVFDSLDLPKNWAKNHLNHHKMLVMFDGFDEVKPEYTEKVSEWIGMQWHTFQGNYFILTSRPKGYEAFLSEHKPRKIVIINEFKDKDIKDFIKNWYVWQERETKTSRSLSTKIGAAERKTKDLINQLFANGEDEKNSPLLEIARNPLNLNMIVRLHWSRSGEPLPEQRVELFRQILDLQLITRPNARKIDMVLGYYNNGEKDRRLVLQSLAFKMGNETTIEYNQLVSNIQTKIQKLKYPKNTSAKDFVERLIHVSELILKRDEYYEFVHNHFQSYLMALEVNELKKEDLLYQNWEQNLWQEACVFYAASIIDPTNFVNYFYNVQSPDKNVEKAAKELAERCYRELPEKKRKGLENLIINRQTSLYAQLETYLKNGQWKEADSETDRLMLQIVGKEADQWLQVDDIQNFPCEDLRAIDKLWVDYSQGKFGFSIQKKVWLDCSDIAKNSDWDVYNKFVEQVGWQRGGGGSNEETMHAHWPIFLWWWVRGDLYDFGASRVMSALFSRNDL